MSRKTCIVTLAVVLALVAYLAAWLVLAAFFVSHSTGGLVMVLLCYWLAWALVGAVTGVCCWLGIMVWGLVMVIRED